jgi:mono/diheme cytochrome c family protein
MLSRSNCLLLSLSLLSAPTAAAQEDVFTKDVVPFLAKYCAACHSGAKAKGGLQLDFKDLSAARKKSGVWEKVVENLRSGEMPPAGRPKPNARELEQITSLLDREFNKIDCTGPRDPGRVTLRRLNRAEYNNTLRDLLGIQFEPANDFPSDDVGYGFDNIGDVLTLSPLLLEKYLAAADQAAALAFAKLETKKRILAPGVLLKKREAYPLVLKALLPRVYRRPVAKDEVDRYLQMIQLAEQNGSSYEQAIQFALKASLVSPHFLFRVEVDPPGVKPGAVYDLNEFELANRLSYFLWSSMPDDELLALAGKKELRKNLEVQTRRMLKDSKARALVENFAGQWLQLRSVKQTAIDPKLFPSFTPALRRAMIEETERFFEAIVKEDRSVLEFLDADWTYVNEALAKHYGIRDVTGGEFVKVKLDAVQRGGVLTQASVLMVTSNPTRTSPVKRGKWIMENILGTPPPPPPPDVPELEDNSEVKGTLRQRMEQHRAKASCAVCHQRMDPLGIAFENYDAIGRWRIKDAGLPIDPSGVLPNGQRFQGPRELRQILLTRADDFRRCLAEKLLTYALGRGVEYPDKCLLADLSVALEKNEHRFSALVLAIVQSAAFQQRRAKS